MRIIGVRSTASTWTVVAVTLLSAAVALSEAGPTGNTPTAQPTVDEIVKRLVIANARRAASLQSYRSKRHYNISYEGFLGTRKAELWVDTSYTAPDHKDFNIISQSGSKFLIDHVILKLLDGEKDYLKEGVRQRSELTPENYAFSLAGIERTPQGDVYVLEVEPRRKDKYLYRGKIWVDAHDYAVTKIEGEPAKALSFWLNHSQLQNRYAKIENFWLPIHNESVSQVRWGGKAVMEIDYSDYQLTPIQPGMAKRGSGAPVMTLPGEVTADPH
jgi:hypothetical protein